MEDQNVNQENIDQNTNPNTDQKEKLQEISQIYNPQSSDGGENVLLVDRSPIDYYILAFQKYAQFSGRSTRSEYWWFYLVNIAVTLLLAIIDSVFSIPFTLLSTIYFFASLIPSLAIQVRRLHDVDKSGWYILLNFVIIIGWIWLLVLNILDSTPGANKYGQNPKGVKE